MFFGIIMESGFAITKLLEQQSRDSEKKERSKRVDVRSIIIFASRHYHTIKTSIDY